MRSSYDKERRTKVIELRRNPLLCPAKHDLTCSDFIGTDITGAYVVAFGIVIFLIRRTQVFALACIFILGFFQLILLTKRAVFYSVIVAMVAERCSSSSWSMCADKSAIVAVIITLICALFAFALVIDILVAIVRQFQPLAGFPGRLSSMPVAYVNQMHTPAPQ